MSGAFWETESALAGVDVNEAGALDLLESVLSPYAAEFRDEFPLRGADGDGRFQLINGSFMAVDAHAYYALVRHHRPARILEIGAGNSTLVAARAALRNARDGAPSAELVAVEPYPADYLKRDMLGLSRLIERKVQEVPLEEFTSLGAGDILFIDSSHALRAGGDVQYEFLEILPRLRPGVLVHVHDVSLPRAYPRVYFERRVYWNEQYLLQAFLAFNRRFEVIWPGNYIMLRHSQRLLAAFPEIAEMRASYPSSEPSSFWMRVRET